MSQASALRFTRNYNVYIHPSNFKKDEIDDVTVNNYDNIQLISVICNSVKKLTYTLGFEHTQLMVRATRNPN